ncbi:metallophosphoesterase family protein [Melissococcus plutonius]|uniref:DNA repair exonuclease family protein YhaO n=1 Tax=Melissococcus plutonius (strain ATCC 35311 / DSM 29964 / CIP 104052 / LMG 20360 / NCIMB 702443) TaxID=940190 RepID=F3YCD1_MELPT|nr:DNA repair exonuclease [Melissococcus plutonius]AIM25366.1 putative metallophosphoesterase YhaO [Melissococcus plutonius S1]KMT24086.1 putative metallophosphoesterase YhaO [Melissococcus plutonius]KMT24239.1 putative metallophosphoesterase YhaO [Melissococcus plutonius]KMT25584.1 putative metallophosphoesterase YhaO [Melissococcus plutonius]KMT28731.1 putative metallophosphoesterase YhaO [Melissococcus plutonius]
MRILHTADLHMDRTFEGLKNLPEVIIKKLQQANQTLITKIVNKAIALDVDLVIFAGDNFHQSLTSIQMQSLFINELKRLEEVNIPVVLTFGNHDYYNKDRYWFAFPENVFVFASEQVETIHLLSKQKETIAISGFSYEHPWINEDKLTNFPIRDSKAAIHIGIYHGDSIRGSEQRYAPFSLSEMKAKGYDYWALGHIHQPQILSTKPLIAYSGTPQGHTKKERDVKGIAIVEFNQAKPTLKFESVAEVCWHKCNCSLETCQSLQEVLSFLMNYLAQKFIDIEQFCLVELQINHIEHLNETFQIAIKNKELLSYLHEALLQNQLNNLWITDVVINNNQKDDKYYLNATSELIHQLAKNYLQPTIFSDITRELTENPVGSKILTIDEKWRQQCVDQTYKKISEDFIIQEDPS